MKKIFGVVLCLISLFLPINSVLADNEDRIYGLEIKNINENGADFYWSTSTETKGSVGVAYTKLPKLYNPQLPGLTQSILISCTPMRTVTENNYVKKHHLKVDNLNIDYHPIIYYEIKSETSDGDVYKLSGEFVLINTRKISWWWTWGFPTTLFILGLIIIPVLRRLRKIYKRNDEMTKIKV